MQHCSQCKCGRCAQGDDDQIKVTGASSSVFADGIFSLSMWFSVGANPCSPNSRDKTLFAQQQSAEPWNWNDVCETGETDTCDSPPNSDADCS